MCRGAALIKFTGGYDFVLPSAGVRFVLPVRVVSDFAQQLSESPFVEFHLDAGSLSGIRVSPFVINIAHLSLSRIFEGLHTGFVIVARLASHILLVFCAWKLAKTLRLITLIASVHGFDHSKNMLFLYLTLLRVSNIT